LNLWAYIVLIISALLTHLKQYFGEQYRRAAVYWASYFMLSFSSCFKSRWGNVHAAVDFINCLPFTAFYMALLGYCLDLSMQWQINCQKISNSTQVLKHNLD